MYCFDYCFVAVALLLNCWKDENKNNDDHNDGEKDETIKARFKIAQGTLSN